MGIDKSELFEMFTPEKENVKNLDLLFKHFNLLENNLLEKKEDAHESGDHDLKRYLDGQIKGVNYARAIVEAFFNF